DLTITPIDDSKIEGPETVTVTLVAGPGYTVGSPNTITITIYDNDQAASEKPVITISEFNAQASETGPTSGLILFRRTGDTSQPIQVNWTFSGSALNGADFEQLPTSSPFPAGLAEAYLTIKPIDDTLVEGNETVTVTLAEGSE